MIPAVNLRPRASLGRVLDDLGATLLDLVAGDPEGTQEIGGVVIHDPLDMPLLPAGALVLGVGVDEPERVVALLHALGREGAAGLVLRGPVQVTPEVRTAVEESGVTLLGLSRGAPWAHLAAMLRSLLAEGDVGVAEPESMGGLPSGDLFAVANAISSLLDAPITIEDRSSRVLAFSGRQDEADPSRVETILGRQVPERYARVLSERGVFRDLHRSDKPVFITPIPMEGNTFTQPRVAVAVRAGDEVLGSIWAAVPGPLSDERTEALCDAAKLVALHLLRVRAGADVQRRLRADLLSSALEGGAGAREALDRLGLGAQPLMVLGVAVTGSDVGDGADGDAVVAHERERLSDAFAMHLSAVHPKSAAALIGGVAYGLVPVPGSADGAEERASRIAQEFLDRVGDRRNAVVGIGPIAGDVGELAHSRSSVDRALRVLRDGGGRRVARLSDIHVEALMLEMRDLVAARGDRPEGALARLMAYDAQHHASLVETLQAWLEAFGDVVAAAERLYVHPNTFRYRLRRLMEVGEMDLSEPDVRFGALLQLRLLPPATSSRTPGE
ncbi:CdaR family transcriptional regulator [Nocardioides sp. cx-173]|uniref:PucR family transcriptional regulator n=1 Tax=Nocardioides sp. cx-173 TaxID=2898796 RepID=UPI001E509EB2|nr:helix-turn-helix domain-containing protein [Nocardioides sp. cx-173]MCD4523959.1 helix-turn-helix domain-containing protein [Nocardioides sp. cx-173]UGB41362.1 helix-turn-helix domain-containing protein [Nocardioides sp. cx-173]